jgi:glucuronate isomerase
MGKVATFAEFIQNDANKDKIAEIEKIIEGYLPDDLDPIETQMFAQKIEKLAKRFDIDKNKKNKIVKAA